MDISVLLALDSEAFQQGLKAATDALGQFKAGADVCFEALGKAQAQIDAAADAAAKEAAKVTEAAEAAKAQAEAEREASRAAKDAANAEEEHGDAAEGLGKELGKAKGAMGALGGAASALRGDFSGVASGTAQAANGLRALGVSMKAVERASVALAAIGAAVAALSAAMAVLRDRAAVLDAIRLDNLAAGADSAAAHVGRLCGVLERAQSLARGLDDAAASGRRMERERKLAELELDRNAALAGGGDADAVNRAFDERRRTLEFSFRREESADSVSAIERDLAANAETKARLDEARRGLLRHANDYRAEASEDYRKGNAGLLGRLARGDFLNQSNEEYIQKGNEASAKAAELDAKALQLEERLQALENEGKVLAAKLEVERGRASVIDVQEEAARLAAAIPGRTGGEEEGRGPKAETSRGAWGGMQAASDRLARIGGFVGGASPGRDLAREQLQEAREQTALMRRVADNTERGGEAPRTVLA